MAGFMLTTMFLSMWISNTATTAMMVPIVEAILAEIETHNVRKNRKVIHFCNLLKLVILFISTD